MRDSDTSIAEENQDKHLPGMQGPQTRDLRGGEQTGGDREERLQRYCDKLDRDPERRRGHRQRVVCRLQEPKKGGVPEWEPNREDRL